MSLTMRCERTAMYRLKIFLVLMSIVLPGAFALSAQPPEQTRTLAWAPDGVRLATGDTAGVIRIWDTSTSSLLRTINAHEGSVYALAWRDDGTQLASSSADRTVRVWDTSSMQRTGFLQISTFPATTLAWDPSGDTLYLGGIEIDLPNRLIAWQPSNDNVVFETRQSVGRLAIAQETSWLLALLTVAAEIRPLNNLERAVGLELEGDYDAGFHASSITASRSGAYIAIGYTNGWVRIWDVQDSRLIEQYDATPEHPNCCKMSDTWVVAVHLDNELLTSVSVSGQLRAWDISTNQLITDVQIGEFFGGAFSPYGGRLAKLSRDAQLRITGVDILVPDPSLERLNGIAAACVPETAARDPFVADSLAEVGAFVERLGALPDDAIPPACRADLLAVAEALLAEDAGE